MATKLYINGAYFSSRSKSPEIVRREMSSFPFYRITENRLDVWSHEEHIDQKPEIINSLS